MARQPARAARGAEVQALRRKVTALQAKVDRLEKSAKAAGEPEVWFGHIADAAQDMVWRIQWVPTRKYEYVNAACVEMSGYAAEEWYADPELHRKIVHPEDIHLIDGLEDDNKRHERGSVTVRWIRKDGSTIWVETRWVRIRDGAGNITSSQGIHRDITERKQTEEALRASEEPFRLMAENARDSIYRYRLTEPSGMEYVSPASEWIFGYTSDEVYADPEIGSKMVHPDDRPLLEEIRNSRDSFTDRFTMRYLGKDGRTVWVEHHRVPVYDDSGTLVAIEGIARNVTEGMEAEEALRRSEERFRLLAENSRDLIYRALVGPPLTMDYISPAIFPLTGYSAEEIYDNPGLLRTIVHPEDLPALEAAWHSAAASGQTVRTRIFHKSGDTRWLEITRTAVTDASGNVVAVEGVGRDVTERIVTEEALRESEERFRMLAENVQDIVYRERVLPERKVEYVSPSIERILGYTPDELYADPTLGERLIHEDDRHLRHIDRLMDETEAQPQRLRCIARDGRTVWLERRSSRFRDENGEIVGWDGISRDVTDQVRLMDELSTAERRLRRLSRSLVDRQEADRRELALELHDEIGQALTGIMMCLGKMERQGNLDKRALQEGLALAADALERVQNLSLELRPIMLDHLGLLPTLKWHVKRFASRTTAKVRFKHSGVDRRLPPRLETAVYRIAQEGLTNIARHAQADSVVVQLLMSDDILDLTVEDSGQGFDVEKMLDSPKATGLMGMAERAASVGGELQIDSEEGQGTRLIAHFPLGESTGPAS